MASTAILLKPKVPKTLVNLHPFLRHSSSTTLSPPPASDADPTTSSPDAKPAPTPYFSDIKAHLKQPVSATRQIPDNPPKPEFLFDGPSFSSSQAASIANIRRELAEFRRLSAPPSPSSSSHKPISLRNLYNRSDDTNPEPLSIDSIRGSLRHLRQNSSQKLSDKLRSTGSSSLSIKGLQDSLKSKLSDFSNLPSSMFRKELEQAAEKDGKEVKGRNTDFVKTYTYKELGEKLRILRPTLHNEEKVKKEGSFSLQELNERLAKLRVLDEKETNSHDIIKDSLMKLHEAGNEKKNALRDVFIFPHIGGFMSQNVVYGPAKENLVEKYFHPDLMSSEEKMKLELKKVREEFKMSESDCGSARVQVAQLTTKIKHLSSVLHKKDKHSQKGLQAMVQRRRKLLKYLRRTDWGSYCFVISKLGLRDAPEYRA